MKRIFSILIVAAISLAASGVAEAANGTQVQQTSGKKIVVKGKPAVRVRVPVKKANKVKIVNRKASYECLSVYDPEVKVDRSPQFRGGDAGLFNFISDNLNYPKKAIEKSVEGSVLVRFAIDTDGKVRDVEVIQSVDPNLDAEAVRVVKSLPLFKPAMKDGKPVQFFYSLPVKFKLN